MAKVPTFNCELVSGDKTMYGLVHVIERVSDDSVRVTAYGGQLGAGERVLYLKADGVTNVRTGKDASEVGL